SVLRRVHQNFTLPAVDGEIGQSDVGDGVIVPVVSGRGLVMPDVFAGRALDGNDAVGAQVVTCAAGNGGPVTRLSGADINHVVVGIVSDTAPDRAAAAGNPPLLILVPGLGPFRIDRLLERLRRIAGNRIELPQFLSGVRVERREKTADGVFAAAGA